jgi:transposase
MSHAVLITGVGRRRKWTPERKLDLLREAFGPGGNVAEVTRREEISSGLLYRWRQALTRDHEPIGFAPAVLAEAPRATEPAAILVELVSGARVEIRGAASPELVTATLKALR